MVSRNAGGAICSLFLLACGKTAVPFTSAYPQDFAPSGETLTNVAALEAFLNVEQIPVVAGARSAPSELNALLPPHFRLAAVTGHLLTLLDRNGYLEFPAYSVGELGATATRIALVEHGRTHLAYTMSPEVLDVRARLLDLGYEEFAPVGYPHVLCFAPRLGPIQMLQDEYSNDWLRALGGWQEVRRALDATAAENAELEQEVSDLAQTLSTLETENLRLDSELSAVNKEIEELEVELTTKTTTTSDIRRVWTYTPPFIPGRYDPSTDFLLKAYEELLENVSQRPWIDTGPEGAQTPFLAGETAAALDSVHAAIQSPSSLPTALAKQVKASGLRRLVVMSAARTPLSQASAARSNRAAAGWLDSAHALGFSVDLNLAAMGADPSPSPANPKSIEAYRALVAVLAHFGLVRTLSPEQVPRERNHFTVRRFSRAVDSKPNAAFEPEAYSEYAAVMFNFFHSAAERERQNQEELGTILGYVNRALLDKASKVSDAVRAARDNHAKKAADLAQRRQTRADKRQALDAKRSRERAERDRQARERPERRDRDYYRDPDRRHQRPEPERPRPMPERPRPEPERRLPELRGGGWTLG